jgi:hypothetical protein
MANITDCFETIDSNNSYKNIFTVVTVICIISVLPGLYAIIWFERFGSDKKRTIINKLLSTICYAGIFADIFVQGIYLLRFTYGPLPSIICFWLCLSKRTVICLSFLLLDSISVVRYIFIFWLKNPAAFKDEFWHLFISTWCVLMSFIFQVLRATIPGNQLVEYSLCTGDNPTPVFLLPSFCHGYVETFSLILQIIICIKIWYYKRQMKKTIGTPAYSSYLKNVFNTDLDNQSLTSLATNIVLGIMLASGSVFIVIVNFKSCQDFQLYPKFIVVYYTYMLYPCISICFFTAVWFNKNPVLRQTIFRELRNLIH